MRAFVAIVISTITTASVLLARSSESPLERVERAFWSARLAALTTYRSSLADALDDTLTVEVLALDFRVPAYWRGVEEPDPQHSFELWRGAKAWVLRRRFLSHDEVVALLPSVKQALVAEWPKGHGLITCYYPTHAIRVVSDHSEVFRMSVSASCRSYTISYPDDSSDRQYLTAPDLPAALADLMPLTEEEKERYRREALGEKTGSETREEKGEPGATDNPDDAQRLREDH